MSFGTAIFLVFSLAFLGYILFGKKKMDKEKAESLKAAGARLVDVRTPAEFSRGHLEGALNIPIDQLSGRLSEIEGKDLPVVLYCASGIRSRMAKGLLSQIGYSDVYDIGTAGGWPI